MQKSKLYGITDGNAVNELLNKYKRLYLSHLENGYDFPLTYKVDLVSKLIGEYLLNPTKDSLILLENPEDLFISNEMPVGLETSLNSILVNSIKAKYLGYLLRDKQSILKYNVTLDGENYYETIELIFDELVTDVINKEDFKENTEYNPENIVDILDDLDSSGDLDLLNLDVDDIDELETINDFSEDIVEKGNNEIKKILKSVSESIDNSGYPNLAKYIQDKIDNHKSLKNVKDKSESLVKDTTEKIKDFSKREEVQEAKDKTKEVLKETKEKIEEFSNRDDVQEAKNQLEQQIKSIFDFGKSKISDFTNEEETPVDFSSVDNILKEDIETSEVNFINELLFKIFSEDTTEIEQEDVSIVVEYLLNNGQKSELEMGIKSYAYGNYLVLTSPQKLVVDNSKHFESVGTDGSQVLYYYLILAQ